MPLNNGIALLLFIQIITHLCWWWMHLPSTIGTSKSVESGCDAIWADGWYRPSTHGCPPVRSRVLAHAAWPLSSHIQLEDISQKLEQADACFAWIWNWARTKPSSLPRRPVQAESRTVIAIMGESRRNNRCGGTCRQQVDEERSNGCCEMHLPYRH